MKEKAELKIKDIGGQLGISKGTFLGWRQRYGETNEHNGTIPRDFWLEE